MPSWPATIPEGLAVSAAYNLPACVTMIGLFLLTLLGRSRTRSSTSLIRGLPLPPPAGPLDRSRGDQERPSRDWWHNVCVRGLPIRSDVGLHTWRTRSGVEVDFVLYGGDVFYAIEVKHSARVRPADLRGLRTFREDYPECQALLLYRGARRIGKGDVVCTPVEEFLGAFEPGNLPG